jgi:hypothetical protein
MNYPGGQHGDRNVFCSAILEVGIYWSPTSLMCGYSCYARAVRNNYTRGLEAGSSNIHQSVFIRCGDINMESRNFLSAEVDT